MTLTPSVERLCIMLSLVAVILATLPRYLIGEHNERLILIVLAALALAVVSAVQWYQLSSAHRRRLPGLLGRFGACVVVGIVVMSGWQFLARGGIDMAIALSQGATLGLLLYVLGLWLRKKPAQ
ncbi:hypothetical protein FGL86_13050 [Pistricoccus aurantiacus]|uniref:Uncharacterized protein n=1 Tax=Pistricoccus aurantiacus TaxID=1883414 RepID=A0A5B8SUE1_9GAMM|nr:hypothetical protein [Pistricoccus aurantiacus]QEA39904.1 hypothetical protein FGL86_13050 [Pistricoccus aurantiacus]